MSSLPTIDVSPLALPESGVLVVPTGENGKVADTLPEAVATLARKAAGIAKFKGKAFATLDIVAPAGLDLDRIVLVGTAPGKTTPPDALLKLGGTIAAKTKGAEKAAFWSVMPDGTPFEAGQIAEIALGAMLRGYEFDRYKTKGGKRNGEEEDEADKPAPLRILTDGAQAATLIEAARAIAEGTCLARDLVNEPANVLGPVEFAEAAQALSAVGVDVEVLDEAKMRQLGMHALLGVAQGSPRPPRLVVMRWSGADGDAAPLAFVGKGVVFDTGGVSIKPAAGMDEMKGDMGGAAAVVGLMRALAGRKAKVDAIGVIGLVENAVDGNAQRPGDIVKAMSGTTIEVLNTDAEGRLVLADALWYTQDRFKPRLMVNLATLTGAIIVALGNHHAGLFSNNDELAERLLAAGLATGEKLWRLPIGPEYDKMIEGKFADIKNIGGGRAAGSIVGAQFLQRFVNDLPWAHLDVAGTAMGSPASEYNQSWGSGYGVRLLDRFVAESYETR